MNRFAYRNLLYVGLALTMLAFYSCQQHQKSTIAWMDGLEVATDTVACLDVFRDWGGDELFVKEDVDLNGKRCSLPKGVTINFQGGVIKNGTLVGDETKIEHSGVCFDKVRIQGTWNVSEISTSMFRDLNYNNSLKDVVALANPNYRNRIIVGEGNYQVSAFKEGDVCVQVVSNTELIINGTIHLTPNNYTYCDIVCATGTAILIKGTGLIVGDMHTHQGTSGEWGMGIEVLNGHNVIISGLTIKDCWGDCIYIGEESTNVLIENCHLDYGRRQGISITSANGVTIRDCEISNVGGTNPEYGIDVEPNGGDVVDHVMIENVTVKDSKGGFLVYGWAANSRVGTVIIRDCDVSAGKKITIAAGKCDTLMVENCDITQHNTWGCVTCIEVGHVEIKNNTLHYDKGLMAKFKDWMRPKFGKKRVKVMEIEDCGTTGIVGNKERKL